MVFSLDKSRFGLHYICQIESSILLHCLVCNYWHVKTISYRICRYICDYLHGKFHLPDPHGSLVIAINWKININLAWWPFTFYKKENPWTLYTFWWFTIQNLRTTLRGIKAYTAAMLIFLMTGIWKVHCWSGL